MILTADINKYIIDSELWRELKIIGIIYTYVKKFNLPKPVSHIIGSKPSKKYNTTQSIDLSLKI